MLAIIGGRVVGGEFSEENEGSAVNVGSGGRVDCSRGVIDRREVRGEFGEENEGSVVDVESGNREQSIGECEGLGIEECGGLGEECEGLGIGECDKVGEEG